MIGHDEDDDIFQSRRNDAEETVDTSDFVLEVEIRDAEELSD